MHTRCCTRFRSEPVKGKPAILALRMSSFSSRYSSLSSYPCPGSIGTAIPPPRPRPSQYWQLTRQCHLQQSSWWLHGGWQHACLQSSVAAWLPIVYAVPGKNRNVLEKDGRQTGSQQIPVINRANRIYPPKGACHNKDYDRVLRNRVIQGVSPTKRGY